MSLFLILGLFSSTLATEMVYTHQTPPIIPIKIIKAQPQSEYLSPKAKFVFDLISTNGSTHTLVCQEEDYLSPEIVKSYLIYSNIAHIKVKHFEFVGHQLCNDFAIFIEAVFEFINDKDPIYLELNTKKHRVQRVILPSLNPYMDRLPEENRKRLQLFTKQN